MEEHEEEHEEEEEKEEEQIISSFSLSDFWTRYV